MDKKRKKEVETGQPPRAGPQAGAPPAPAGLPAGPPSDATGLQAGPPSDAAGLQAGPPPVAAGLQAGLGRPPGRTPTVLFSTINSFSPFPFEVEMNELES